MADLDKGDKARVRPVIIAGDIIGRRFDQEEGHKELLLSWTDAEGEPHQRWFKPDELEAIPDDGAAA